ncbi:O-acetyltransferase CAS1 like protein [Verticillium longisporum]|uniref:O-acetyltransferase CAS1 like protein n=1 Tax=Verticillium longisporum TaxID=100787 RepID=A0A8I2ZKL8_VERLO|nr:O-acetyltransferase CAS1 like protein [Verticillium longisporum]
MLNIVSRVLLVFLGALLLAAATWHTLTPDDDPYRCRALQETGNWIDPKNEKGDRLPFKTWQPEGCLLHKYTSADIRQCMDGRHVIFAGDSTTRQIAYGIARLLERDEAEYDRTHVDFHSSFNLTYHGVDIQQHWVPFLEVDGPPFAASQGKDKDGHIKGEHDIEHFVEQLNLMRDELEKKPASIKGQKGPAFAMLGVGAWFSGDDKEGEASNTVKYEAAISNVSDILGSRKDFWKAPMDPIDGIGNQVFFAPPAGPYYTGKDHKEGKAKAATRVTAMQKWLRETADKWNFQFVWSIPGLVEHDKAAFVDPTQTGFHVIESVAEIKANILLNLRCNARLDRVKGYPYQRTCCSDYGGSKPLTQLVLVGFGMVYLVVCILAETWDLIARRSTPRYAAFNMETGSFVMALLMCFFADRTHILGKGAKVWHYANFAIMCAPCLAVAIVTIRKSKPPRAKPGQLVEADQPFLSRDQTDEWKGWMQFVILVYHWTAAARSTGIYIFVRLLVAAYLFQTGYGHTTFFLVKKDFSFKRMASVMLRLNLLSVSLAYFMNTDYMFYYFSPLVSFWFMVVYLTMAVGHKRYNDDIQLVLAKICISAVIVAVVVLATPLTKWTFGFLRIFFNIKWSLEEWEYRVALDLFIVYIGMLSAIAYLKVKEELRLALRCSMALVGLVVMAGYAYACGTTLASMGDYRLWHPYLSFVPILAFIAVRNVSAPVRNYYSKGMAWLGQCSLETYTLQFHLFLAADTQGVLLINQLRGDGSNFDRWKSLLVIVPVFLWVSSLTANATNNLVKIILSESRPEEHAPRPLPQQEEKERAEDSDDEDGPYMYEQGTGLLGRSRTTVSRYFQEMPPLRSMLHTLQARIVFILLVMWLFNLLTPGPIGGPVPDGFTPHRVGSGDATKASAPKASASAA